MKNLSKIKYLSFEGGGGKGNAYVGALNALEQLKIIGFKDHHLQGNIKGISGASAGAIIALLLGSGYSYKELFRIMQARDFNDFFDLPVLGEVVIAGKGFSHNYSSEELRKVFKDSPNWLSALQLLLNPVIGLLIGKSLNNENVVLAKRLKANSAKYLSCLIYDQGLFSGLTIQKRFFEELIQYKIFCIKNNLSYEFLNEEKNLSYNVEIIKSIRSQIDRNLLKPCTFQEHFDIFKVELAFTSVNLVTENVQVFSYKTCPNFPISTAARMSMSLPCIYKPVIVNKDSLSALGLLSDFEGVYIDGGLFDNAPARVFNDTANTVLFRLGNRQANNKITNMIDFLKVYLKLGVMGSGSGQVNRTTVPDLNVIELDVLGLSLLKFNLLKQDFEDLANFNFDVVADYFSDWKP